MKGLGQECSKEENREKQLRRQAVSFFSLKIGEEIKSRPSTTCAKELKEAMLLLEKHKNLLSGLPEIKIEIEVDSKSIGGAFLGNMGMAVTPSVDFPLKMLSLPQGKEPNETIFVAEGLLTSQLAREFAKEGLGDVFLATMILHETRHCREADDALAARTTKSRFDTQPGQSLFGGMSREWKEFGMLMADAVATRYDDCSQNQREALRRLGAALHEGLADAWSVAGIWELFGKEKARELAFFLESKRRRENLPGYETADFLKTAWERMEGMERPPSWEETREMSWRHAAEVALAGDLIDAERADRLKTEPLSETGLLESFQKKMSGGLGFLKGRKASGFQSALEDFRRLENAEEASERGPPKKKFS